MGTSSAFLCLDPLPSHPSMLHSHDLISPVACCWNRWLLNNTAAVQDTVCVGDRLRDSGMFTVERISTVNRCLSSYGCNRDVMDWWWHLLPSSPNVPQCSLVCVTDAQKLEVQMTWNVSFVRNFSAIWIPSSCPLPTCCIVRFRCCTWVSHFTEADYSKKQMEAFCSNYEFCNLWVLSFTEHL